MTVLKILVWESTWSFMCTVKIQLPILALTINILTCIVFCTIKLLTQLIWTCLVCFHSLIIKVLSLLCCVSNLLSKHLPIWRMYNRLALLAKTDPKNFFFQGRSPDTGSPGPRSSGRSWLPSLSGTLIACPTCFLHYKLLAPTI